MGKCPVSISKKKGLSAFWLVGRCCCFWEDNVLPRKSNFKWQYWDKKTPRETVASHLACHQTINRWKSEVKKVNGSLNIPKYFTTPNCDASYWQLEGQGIKQWMNHEHQHSLMHTSYATATADVLERRLWSSYSVLVFSWCTLSLDIP